VNSWINLLKIKIEHQVGSLRHNIESEVVEMDFVVAGAEHFLLQSG
jgi:hypothetical protein